MTHFDVGDKVVKVIIGGGTKTASLATVTAIDGHKVYVNESEVLCWDNRNRQEIDPVLLGFTSELIYLEGA